MAEDWKIIGGILNYLKTYFFDIIFKNYSNCAGRATRKEFWLFSLNVFIVFIFFVIAYYIDSILTISYFEHRIANPDSVSFLSGVIINYEPYFFYVLCFLAVTALILIAFPYLNLASRRLHDANFSAWWLLLVLIPKIGYLVILVFMCLPGTNGENKYDVEPGKKKFGFAGLTVILMSLLEILIGLFVVIYRYNQLTVEKHMLLDNIAKAEFKYFEQNKDFLYIDKTDSNEILDINIKTSKFYNEFSCLPPTEKTKSSAFDKNKKYVEIQIWNKINKRDKERDTRRYSFILLSDDGEKTKPLSGYTKLNLSANE